MLNPDRSYITYEKLNEQCRRAADIIERHYQKAPAIESQKSVLMPIIDHYLDEQEQLALLRARGKQALEEGNGSVKDLYRSMRSWFGQLRIMVAGFDRGDFRCDPESPDSVIGAADRLIDFVRSHRDAVDTAGGAGGQAGTEAGGDANDGTGAGPANAGGTGAGMQSAFLARIVEDLGTRRNAAHEKWIEAQDCLAEEQELRNSIRESAIEVQHALAAIRRALRNTLGTSHRDYQKMRLSRGRRGDEAGDESEAVEQVEGLDADEAVQGGGIGEDDTIESEPLVVKTPPEAEDRGNGKGKAADVASLLSSGDQASPEAGA